MKRSCADVHWTDTITPEQLCGVHYDNFNSPCEMKRRMGMKPNLIVSAEGTFAVLQRLESGDDHALRARIEQCKEWLRTEIYRQAFQYVACMRSRLERIPSERWEQHDGAREFVAETIAEYERKYLGGSKVPITMVPDPLGPTPRKVA